MFRAMKSGKLDAFGGILGVFFAEIVLRGLRLKSGNFRIFFRFEFS
jgi:hypothetical protein